MHTVLIRLEGPLQAWGVQSRFRFRDTLLEPSKSGVLGLVCAALGRSRAENVDDLARLRFDLRVEREGIVRDDYQTASDIAAAHGRGTVKTAVSHRFYLADAAFLAALSGEDRGLLEAVDAALGAPVWPLALGRKSMPPGMPVRLDGGGVRSGMRGKDALRSEPGEAGLAERRRVVLEAEEGPGVQYRRDQPAPGPAFMTREFLLRPVVTEFWTFGPVGGAAEPQGGEHE